jgi:hypothetical protein
MLHYLFSETKDQLKTISLRGMVLTHDHENQIKLFFINKKSNSMWQAKDVILHVLNFGGCARNQTLHPRGKR